MEQLRSILVAIDFSEPSLNALEAAVALAVSAGATLTIVQVNERIGEMPVPGSEGSRLQQASDILNALANDIFRKHSLHARLVREEGSASHAVIRQAITARADLVITGTYGASGYREGFIGTTAYNVIKMAPCPVLNIPAGRKWIPFKKILMPVRPGMIDVRQLSILRNFAAGSAIIETLSLYPSDRVGNGRHDDELVSGLETYTNGSGIRNIPVSTREGFLPDNVLAHAEMHNTDLIVLTPSVDVSTKQHYIGPYSQKILHNARVPVLTLNRN